MKNIATLSGHIDSLSASKRQAEQQLDAAIGALYTAHEHLRKATASVAALTEGGSTLGELAKYLDLGRELSAETMLALLQMRPDNSVTTGKDWKDVVTDARAGMQAKRLAKWEADALREAVVDGLAGNDK